MPERMRPLGTGQRFLTIAEVSEWIGFHPVTVRDWARCGRLPAMRIAGLDDSLAASPRIDQPGIRNSRQAYAVLARARVCLNCGLRSGYSGLFGSVYPQFPHNHAPSSSCSKGLGFTVRWRSVRGHMGTVTWRCSLMAQSYTPTECVPGIPNSGRRGGFYAREESSGVSSKSQGE
jgi:hypothetical protein